MTQARKLFALLLCLAIGQMLLSQTTYTTIAGGNWDDAATWDANGIPPNPIPANATVEIKHVIFSLVAKTNNGTINLEGTSSVFAMLQPVSDFDNYGTVDMKNTYSELRGNVGTFNNKSGGVVKGNYMSFWNGATFNNEAGALVDINIIRVTSQGANSLNNAGILNCYGSGTSGSSSYGPITNSAGAEFNAYGPFSVINNSFTNGGAIKTFMDYFSVQGTYTGQAGSSIEWILPESGSVSTDYPTFENFGTGDYSGSTLTVSLANGFEPSGGDIFNIFTGSSVPTNPISLPTLSGGKTWKETRTSSQIILEVEAPAPTDPGAALASSGDNQLITVPDNASLDIECELSIEFWCKPTAYETWGAIVMKASGNSWSNGYGIYLRGDVLNFYPTGFGSQHNTGYVVPLNQWIHIAATYDGNESKVYVNGILESSKTIGLPIPTNNYPMGISGDPGDPRFNFNGHLDEVRVWGKVLSQSEIQSNMNCEIQTTSDCLAANYHFNQGGAGADNSAITTLTDASGNGNNGTLGSGYALTGTTSNWVAPGGVTSGQACSGSIVCEPIVSAEPTCPSNIVVNNEAGKCGAVVTFAVQAGEVATPASGSFFPVGTYTVEITGASGCGEASTCSFTVTVNDTEKPSISCPSNATVGTDAGVCGADVHLPAPNASDNCGVTELKGRYRLVDEDGDPLGSYTSRTNDLSDYLAVGRYQVNWRAADAAGEKRSCSYFVTVEDDEDPTAVCKDVTVDFNGQSDVNLSVSQVWNESASDDNCGTLHYVGTSPSLSISCEDVGNSFPLTVTIRDEAGNMDNCTAMVNVIGLACGWSEGANDGSLNCGSNTSATYDPIDESFDLTANGCWHDCLAPDKAAHVYQLLCGDGQLTARLASINSKGYAGLMARESLDPESRRAGVLKNNSTRRVRREYRASNGGAVTQRPSNRSRVEWLRIVRQGTSIKSYTSTNGSSWRLLYKVTFPGLADCIYVDMMAYSLSGSAEVEATFDQVSITGGGSSYIDNTTLPGSFTQLDTDIELGEAELNIFPNPSNGVSQLELNGFADVPAQIWVRDAFGKVVRQIELDAPQAAVLSLDLTGLPAGLYLISAMQDQQEVVTKKLVLQR